MSRPSSSVCLRPLVVLLLGLSLPTARGEEGAEAWTDAAWLEAAVSRALPAVEEACGAKFERPPSVVVSTRAALRGVVEAEMGDVFRRLGAGEPEQVRAASDLVAGMLVAKYEPGAHRIHVVGENAVRLTDLLGLPELRRPDVLRVVLVHEVVHALDFQRFPALEKERQSRETADGLQAVGAVVEGHAQLVTEVVAARWGLQGAFDDFVRLVVSTPPTEDVGLRMIQGVLAAETSFAYVRGHRFLKALEAAGGREAVERALESPPAATTVIERPELFLDPAAAGEAFQPDELLAAFDPVLLVEGWRRSDVRVKRSQLEAVFEPLPAEETRPVLDALRDGWGRAAVSPAGDRMAVVAVLEFDAPEAAGAYVRLVRRLSERKDELLKEGTIRVASATYRDGAGPGATLPGFVVDKVVRVMEAEQKVSVHATHAGAVAFELTLVDAPVEAAAVEGALAAAAARLATAGVR